MHLLTENYILFHYCPTNFYNSTIFEISHFVNNDRQHSIKQIPHCVTNDRQHSIK